MMQNESKKKKHLGLHIDQELHYKLHHLARYEGRSANGEVLYLIRQAIAQFEAEHGTIEQNEQTESIGK